MVKTQKLRTSSSKRILGYVCSFFTDNIKPRKSVTVAYILILPASYSSLKFEVLWFRVFDLHGTTLIKQDALQALVAGDMSGLLYFIGVGPGQVQFTGTVSPNPNLELGRV